MQKGQVLIFLLIGILVITVAGGAYYFGKLQSQRPQDIATPPPLPSSIEPSINPEEVVKTFYSTWLNCEKEFDKYALKNGPIPQEVSKQREDCIKKAMADYTVIQKEHPTDNKMWCAQNIPSSVNADKATIAGNTATVVSHHLFEQSGDNQIKVTLTLIGNTWKISDTTCLRSNSSATDETANWKTYTNTKYGFSIKYPQNLNFTEQTSDTYLLLVAFKEQGKVMVGGGFDIEVRAPKSLDDEITYRKWTVVGHVTDGISEEKRIKKDGFDGVVLYYEATNTSGNKQKSTIAIIKTDKYAYSIYSKATSADLLLSNLKFYSK